jgi:hypothetical protein
MASAAAAALSSSVMRALLRRPSANFAQRQPQPRCNWSDCFGPGCGVGFPFGAGGAKLVEKRPGRTSMAHLSISELLIFTCIGTFIASLTYAVTLLH